MTNVDVVDISFFMDDFLSLLLSLIGEVYNVLSNIEFFGFSLLTYFISLFVLLASIPLVITIINTQSSKANGKGEVIIRKTKRGIKRKTDEVDSWFSDVYREEY